MNKRDIIVVGASAGGVEALLHLVKSLPDNFDASIFIVLHLAPYAPSKLPEILSKAGRLKAVHPEDGEEITPGQIYLAPPDHHLILAKDNRIAVKRGPKENRFRPSIDALFRSAALIYGSRVIGIILSGLLDDGTSGMWNIKRCGGVAIVQDPEEALFPSMPENVLQYVEVDHIIQLDKMGELLPELINQEAPKEPELTLEQMKLLQMEVVIASSDNAFEIGILNRGELTTLTCPECNGALVSFKEGELIRFRCHTGHAYSSSTLLASVSSGVEEKLWEAIKGMEETTMLLHQIADHYKKAGYTAAFKQFQEKADEVARRARAIHETVFTQELMSEDLRFDKEE